jgi:hypothetical protein
MDSTSRGQIDVGSFDSDAGRLLGISEARLDNRQMISSIKMRSLLNVEGGAQLLLGVIFPDSREGGTLSSAYS